MRLLSAKRSINDINRSDVEKNLIKTLFDRYLLSNIELLNAIKVQTTWVTVLSTRYMSVFENKNISCSTVIDINVALMWIDRISYKDLQKRSPTM